MSATGRNRRRLFRQPPRDVARDLVGGGGQRRADALGLDLAAARLARFEAELGESLSARGHPPRRIDVERLVRPFVDPAVEESPRRVFARHDSILALADTKVPGT